jgi:hypothetical protein
MFKKYHFLAVASLSLLLFENNEALAQVPNTPYGQNRVQYKDFNFSYYSADHFTIYFYQGGQDIGKYVVKHCEDFYEELSAKLDVKVKGKTDIIVYNTLEDLNQTNIGIYNPDQNQGGEARLPNDKIFIYFNGDHAHLDEQIRAGIARVMGLRALSGRNRATRFYKNIPDWYNEGLTKYLSKQWSAEDENILRDGILSKRYASVYKLSDDEKINVGHSVWHYIAERYGKLAVTNAIYLTRLNRSTDYGFQFALGLNTKDLLAQWYEYYSKRFAQEAQYTIPPREKDNVEFSKKFETDYYQPVISNGGKYIAYAANRNGKVFIHLLESETNKNKVIFKYGWQTKTLWTDRQLPLLAFTPKGDKLSIIYNKRAVNRFLHYNIEDGKSEKARIEKFQKVTSFSYAPDGKSVVMSAIQKGQSDIFIYKLNSTTVTQITDDYFDDIDPSYCNIEDFNGVIFASNRVSDTLIKERYENQVFSKIKDIFYFDVDRSQLYQITNTPTIDERNPKPFSANKYQFLSDKNGIMNIHTGELETVFDHHNLTYYLSNKEYGDQEMVTFPEDYDYLSILDTSEFKVDSTIRTEVFKTKGKNHQLTNFAYDIEALEFDPKKNLAIIQTRNEGKVAFYKFKLDTSVDNSKFSFYETVRVNNKKTTLTTGTSPPKQQPIVSEMIVIDENNTPKKVAAPYDFQTEFDFYQTLPALDSILSLPQTIVNETPSNPIEDNEQSTGYRFKQSKVRPYFVKFLVDKIITQFNNDPIITPYQPFNAANLQYTFQPVNILFKLGITDLLEDHKVHGGLLFPTLGAGGFSFRDLGYFLTYENLKKRWDKKVTFLRQSVSGTSNTLIPGTIENITGNNTLNYSIKTNYLQVEWKYPFDVFHAVKLSLAYRGDRYVFKSENNYSLFLNDVVTHWAIGRAEYVFDNSYEVMDNIRNGTRAKAFVEIHKDIPTKLYDVGSEKWRLPSFNNTVFGVFGIDARHYQRIYKQLTLAIRATFSSSIGNANMMHYLGGTENNLLTTIPAVSNLTGHGDNNGGAPIEPGKNFVYQTIVSPVRGFVSNTRNGSNAATLNLELRAPIISILSRYRVRNQFLRNFQIVAFMDGGAAWSRWDVFSGNYQTFFEEYKNGTSTLRIEKVKAPAVFGTGFGFRASLLGYFIKWDMAWGFDSGEWSQKPLHYLGFGFDF